MYIYKQCQGSMHVCMYEYMYVFMHVCMYARMYVCMYVCTYVCMHVCTYVCMHVYGYMVTPTPFLRSPSCRYIDNSTVLLNPSLPLKVCAYA